MRYPIEEKLNQAQKESKDIDHRLGRLYLDSSSIEDFKVKADLENMPKSKVFWLVAYYTIRQRKTLAHTIAFTLGMAFAIVVCIGIEALCQHSNLGRAESEYLGALCCGIIIGIHIGSGLMFIVNGMLDVIPNKFWLKS